MRSPLLASGTLIQTQVMLLCMIDYLKMLGVTALFTTLQIDEKSIGLDVSSIMDTWIRVANERIEPPRVCRRPQLLRDWGYGNEEDIEEFFT